MKLSNKPRHYAPKNNNRVYNNKNRPGHRSLGGFIQNRRLPNSADLVRLFMESLSRRTRAYINKKRSENKPSPLNE